MRWQPGLSIIYPEELEIKLLTFKEIKICWHNNHYRRKLLGYEGYGFYQESCILSSTQYNSSNQGAWGEHDSYIIEAL